MANIKHINAATNFLTRCFSGDIPAIATIIAAQADCIDGKKEGEETIIAALKDVQEFCGDIITAIEKKDGD